MIIGDSEKNHRIHCSVEWSHAEIYCKFFTATLQVKVFAWSPFGNQLFWFWGDFFTKQVASSEILGAMVTKMVATWMVELV